MDVLRCGELFTFSFLLVGTVIDALYFKETSAKIDFKVVIFVMEKTASGFGPATLPLLRKTTENSE